MYDVLYVLDPPVQPHMQQTRPIQPPATDTRSMATGNMMAQNQSSLSSAAVCKPLLIKNK